LEPAVVGRRSRVFLYGYRYGEVKLPKLPEIKTGTVFTLRPDIIDIANRPVVQVSLGCHVEGAALPHCDPRDPDTTIAGVRKRAAFKPPKAEPALLEELRQFTRRYVRKHYSPISPDADTSVETWLSKTNYPEWRKEELRRKWSVVQNIRDRSKGYFRVKSFMKDEVYPEYKHARGINSRSDEFKCAVGPIFKLMEEIVYADPSFIKHVPVKDRPNYIMERLYFPGAKYSATDYTAFESLFVKELMEACEFELYSYLTQKLPDGDDFMDLIRTVLTGINDCLFKTFRVRIPAARMSGEMNTSLGNGFSNLMFMLFLCEKNGCTNVKGVVEGDDGFFSCVGKFPTSADFSRLGLVIKMEIHEKINTASFCGIIFDPDERINLTDPVGELLTFGYTTTKYAKCKDSKLRLLLRCKSLSLAHQYPGCPIVAELAEYGLRMTNDVRAADVAKFIKTSGSLNNWEREQMLLLKDCKNIPFRDPGINTRLLCEEKFGVSVEYQIAIEKYIRSLTSLMPLSSPLLDDIIPPVARDYFNRYSAVRRLDEKLDEPAIYWGKMEGWKKEW